jgi:hypothetical protein
MLVLQHFAERQLYHEKLCSLFSPVCNRMITFFAVFFAKTSLIDAAFISHFGSFADKFIKEFTVHDSPKTTAINITLFH